MELVHQLHSMDLIHADLKPDNFLVTDFPGLHNRALQMIDFGKALDMKLVREADKCEEFAISIDNF